MKLNKILAGLAFASVAVAATAGVTFDPTTGVGFVGKGDVQSAFGWNNPVLQAQAGTVTFEFSNTVTYTATCIWVTGQKDHSTSVTTTIGVGGDVAYDARHRNQITGFNLTGYENNGSSDGEIPVEGASCDGEGNNNQGTWGPVTSDATDAGLTVSTSAPAPHGPQGPVTIWTPAP